MSLVVEVLPSLQCLRSHDLLGKTRVLIVAGSHDLPREEEEFTEETEALAEGFHGLAVALR